MEPTQAARRRVRYQFEIFCMKIIDGERCDYLRQLMMKRDVYKRQLVKLAVTDRDYAETVLSVPTTGRLPEQPGEIALDEFTMGSLGILKEIGAPVTLQWTDTGLSLIHI